MPLRTLDSPSPKALCVGWTALAAVAAARNFLEIPL